MKYLNRSFSVGGPLKGVTDKDWLDIWAPKCYSCGRAFRAKKDIVEWYDGKKSEPARFYHEACYQKEFPNEPTR